MPQEEDIARHFERESFKTVPWKNGKGLTLEIFKIPHPDYPTSFLLKLSAATIGENSEFSTFPGVDRKLLVLRGEGIKLHLQSNEYELKVGSPTFNFQGEDSIKCSLLGGEVGDFNVMVDRTWGRSELSLLQIDAPAELRCDSDFLFLYDSQNPGLWLLEKNETITLDPASRARMIMVKIEKFI